jgi:Na+-translocating ferredoxin:NAD+ oxidoreductase RnfG subunit
MSRIHHLILPAIVLAAPAYSATYHTLESAQRACYPEGGEFVNANLTLTKEQKKSIEKSSGSRMRGFEQQIWKVTRDGKFAGWFIVDEVIGKHEYITYAVALNTEGAVTSLEIMDYRENYGSEVQRADWRHQFVGKQNGARLKLTDDVKNISGATLSCRHITVGVKRLLALHELLLNQ